MPCWPVSYRDGIYQVSDGDGILYPITMDRRPVEVFNPGWHATGLQTGLPPFHLLELRHEGPPELDAVWYLSDELDFVANTPRHFDQNRTAEAVAALSPLLADIHDQTLCAPEAAVAASSHAFDGIKPVFVREMIGFVVETALSPPDMVMAQRLEGVSSHYAADGTRLSTSLLRHSLDVAMPAQAPADRMPPGNGPDPVMLASPFDATLLTAQEHFRVDAGPFAEVLRFRDPVGQMTLYLLFQQDGAAFLYIPALNTVFTVQEGLSGAEVMTALLSYYACHTRRSVGASSDAGEPPAEPPALAMPDARPEAAATHPAVSHPDDTAAGAPHPKWWKRLLGLGTP